MKNYKGCRNKFGMTVAILTFLMLAFGFVSCAGETETEYVERIVEVEKEKQNFIVSFDCNGGSMVDVPFVLVAEGGTVSEPKTPSRAGYEFSGWYDGENLFSFSAPISTNVKLTAHWNIITYTITYHLNGGEWAGGSYKKSDGSEATNYAPTTTYTVEDSVFLPDSDEAVLIGYGLSGWFENEDLAGIAVRGFEKGTLGNKEYYAKWAEHVVIYTVKHYEQDLDDDNYSLHHVEQCSGLADTQTEVLAESYRGFTAKPITQATISEDGSTVVEIYYDRNLYTVTYSDGVNGTDIAVPPSQTALFGETVTVSFSGIGKRESGYAFTGWSDGKTVYTKYGKQTFIIEDSDVMLSAQWIISIGTKAPGDAKEVGDIVFSDGSATPYTSGLTLTNVQKNAAVAVIFYVGTECSNDGTNRTLGVGLAQNQSGLAWCSESANAYSKNIATIHCPASGNAGALTFTGDKDGSDNLSQIGTFLSSIGSIDDTGKKGNYPAFYYAKNYASQAGSHVSGTTYADGWYLPSIAELFQVWKSRETVNAALGACGGTKLDLSKNKYYWSSSQYAYAEIAAFFLYFPDGNWLYANKSFSYTYVRCIRAF